MDRNRMNEIANPIKRNRTRYRFSMRGMIALIRTPGIYLYRRLPAQMTYFRSRKNEGNLSGGNELWTENDFRK